MAKPQKTPAEKELEKAKKNADKAEADRLASQAKGEGEQTNNNPENTGANKPEEASKPEETKKATDPLEEADSVDVLRGEIYIRSFSEQVHGEDFLSLAKQFSSKPSKYNVAMTVVPSDTVPLVEVRYREKEDFEKKLDDQDPNAPQVDKVRQFSDKEAALSFNIEKKGTVVVSKKSFK